MTEYFSADTDDLDAFADQAISDDHRLAALEDTLSRQRAALSGIGLPGFVDRSEVAALGELRALMAETGHWVASISTALKLWGSGEHGPGHRRAPVELIERYLVSSAESLLDELLEQELGDGAAELLSSGLSSGQVGQLRAEIERALRTDPTLSLANAVVAGAAAYEGVTVEEFERRRRAFGLLPVEVAATVGQHYDELAGRANAGDELTVDDLRLAVADDGLPSDVRDAAYRLAADAVLFTNMDVADQTDLSAEPLTNGFRWDQADGNISRGDVEAFAAKNHQAAILLAWHPLVETANQGYDLTRADSHAGADDVIAFVEDDDIPLYVRLAVFDVYAERHQLDMTVRTRLEQELAFDGSTFGGGRTVLDARTIGGGRLPVVPSLTGAGSRPGLGPSTSTVNPGLGTAPGSPAAGGGGGGAAVAAVMAQLLLFAGTKGWEHGSRARIERTGSPTFIHTDPQTGTERSLDLAVLAHLSPAELKAHVEHFAAYGMAPDADVEVGRPHVYLDQSGQWRMSDTDAPVWTPPPDGQFRDSKGNFRWRQSGELVKRLDTEPQLATDGAGARKGNDQDASQSRAEGHSERIINPSKPESSIWADFKHHNATTRTNGLTGKRKRYYQWDGAHNDIEVYDSKGLHLGSMHPTTGEMYKPAETGREIKREI